MERGVDLVDLACTRCGLSRDRTQVVPAEGSRTAPAFLVGEGPGPEEDSKGRPFVGRAGKLLRSVLERTGWRGEDVWITNIVKCFPHDRDGARRRIRAPMPIEAAACRVHLRRELEAIRPRLLVALGRTAAHELTGVPLPNLDRLHGTVLPTRPELGDHWVFLTFHPSGLHYARGRLEAFEKDLRTARALLEDLVSGR